MGKQLPDVNGAYGAPMGRSMKPEDMKKIIPIVVAAYVDAVYFTDTGDSEQPPSDAELSGCAYLAATQAVADFLLHCANKGLLQQYVETGRTWDSFGHDIWLTRNRHGAGFWDRGMGALGDALAEEARCMGTAYIYQDDDGLIYFD